MPLLDLLEPAARTRTLGYDPRAYLYALPAPSRRRHRPLTARQVSRALAREAAGKAGRTGRARTGAA